MDEEDEHEAVSARPVRAPVEAKSKKGEGKKPAVIRLKSPGSMLKRKKIKTHIRSSLEERARVLRKVPVLRSCNWIEISVLSSIMLIFRLAHSSLSRTLPRSWECPKVGCLKFAPIAKLYCQLPR